MSPKNPPKRSLGKKVIGSVEGSNLLTQKSMAEGTKEWLRNITAGNQSAETLNPILSTQPFSREISVVSGIEGHRPGLHSRKSSRESRLPGRPPSAHQNAVRNSGPATAPAPAAPPTPIVKRFRFCAIIPFLLSATAFSFSLVLVLAGSKPGYMMDVNIISVSPYKLTYLISFGLNTPYGVQHNRSWNRYRGVRSCKLEFSRSQKNDAVKINNFRGRFNYVHEHNFRT